MRRRVRHYGKINTATTEVRYPRMVLRLPVSVWEHGSKTGSCREAAYGVKTHH